MRSHAPVGVVGSPGGVVSDGAVRGVPVVAPSSKVNLNVGFLSCFLFCFSHTFVLYRCMYDIILDQK